MKILGNLYTGTSDGFFRGLCPICRTIKAAQHDAGVLEDWGWCEWELTGKENTAICMDTLEETSPTPSMTKGHFAPQYPHVGGVERSL